MKGSDNGILWTFGFHKNAGNTRIQKITLFKEFIFKKVHIVAKRLLPSSWPPASGRLPVDWFLLNLIWEWRVGTLWKCDEKNQIWLKSDRNTRNFTRAPKNVPFLLAALTFQSLPVTWCTNSLTFKNCTLCPHCIYVICIYLRTNSDLCSLQHKLIGFYNSDEKCLLRGTDWIFK